MTRSRTVLRGQRIAVTASLALCLLSLPLAADSQQPGRVYRIGVLCPTQCVPTHPLWQPLTQGPRDFGWVEGQNFIFDFRHALGQPEQMAKLAAELVGAKPDVLVAPSPFAAEVLKNATRTIPIVFVGVFNPVHSGFVASLARPGGNMTGLTTLAGPGLDGKRLEILLQAVPRIARVAVLSTPWNEPYNTMALQELDVAAKSLNARIWRIDIRHANDIEPALLAMARDRVDALHVLLSPLTFAQAARIGELATRYRIPATTGQGLVTTGYLLSYGPNFADMYRRTGYYIDKILRGSKPADVPVEQPTTFELVINMQTARALGLIIPQSLLISAERIVQ